MAASGRRSHQKVGQLQDASESATEFKIFEKDLPMSANVNEVEVIHYLLSMKFNFASKVMKGTTIIFVTSKRTRKENGGVCDCGCPEKIVLDSCALKVSSVSFLQRLQLSGTNIHQRKYWLQDTDTDTGHCSGSHDWFNITTLRTLKFESSRWSTVIHDWCQCYEGPPSPAECAIEDKSIITVHVLRIDYQTIPGTPSLHWRPSSGFYYHSPDPNHTYVVYTPGSLVNNRGLFPCQDAPTAAATWEAVVRVQQPYQALLTSEQIGRRIRSGVHDTMGEGVLYYYYSTHKMPVSTFAIIVGVFTEQSIVDPAEHAEHPGLIPTRFLSLTQTSPTSVMNWDKIRQYTRNVLQAACNTFGPHPYPRLDIVIMPTCFQTLGLASPYLIFLSPTNFAGKESCAGSGLLYYARIPHEISHAWFGLAIGAKDWNETWLSEGFATFAEDVLYEQAQLLAADEAEDPGAAANRALKVELEAELELKACVMLHTLKGEIGSNSNSSDTEHESEPRNSDPEFRTLASDSKTSNSSAIPNGLVPLRQFVQAHYLKGVLFLRYLCNLVGGLTRFLPFLKAYVVEYNGRLISSQEFIQFYFQVFQHVLRENGIEKCEHFYEEWFYKAELPESLRSIHVIQMIQLPASIPSEQNSVLALQKCQDSFQKINQAFKGIQDVLEGNCSAQSQRVQDLNSHELILLFEMILDSMSAEEIQEDSHTATTSSRSHHKLPFKPECIEFTPESQNPEVLHRWCEILLKAVIAEPDSELNVSRLTFIASFLLQHPAMGLYLYGELMISELPSTQRLAKSLYRKQLQVLDSEAKSVLKDMIF